MLTDALKLLLQGLSIIPLKPRSKDPWLSSWKEFQTRQASEDEVRAWFHKEPNLNVAIVTGKLSGVVVVDLDGENAIKHIAQIGLSSPVTCLSASGKHLYFKWNEELRNSASKIADGVDIRGDGGYIVAPPSIHPSGLRYRWVGKPTFSALSTVPTSIWKTTTSVCTSNSAAVKPPDWVSEALEAMKNGHIHNTLISVLGKFRSHNFSEEDTYKLLYPYALENGKPYTELRNKITEFWNRYEPSSMHQVPPMRRLSSSLVLHSPASPDSQRLYNDIRERKSQTNLDYPTGYPDFDKLTNGLTRGDVCTIAARTGIGKTNWLVTPSRKLCADNKSVLYFSTEMSFDQIWDRYKAALPPTHDFTKDKLTVCDEFAPNLERIEEALKLVMPDVFIFDHINNIGDEQTVLSEFMKGLKFLARKFNIPCIIAAQLNRAADWVENGERVKPRLSMIKGSGVIEEVSSTVLLLSETRLTSEGSEIEGVVDKARWGDKGIVHFILKRNPYRMEEVI